MSEPGAGWDCHVHVFDATRPTRAGHYRPAHRPLDAIEAEAAAQGVGHLVLVQPSVYGTDHSLLLQALQASPGRHRGVVVLPDEVDGSELQRLHDLGVRGARLNLVSPVGESAPLARRFEHLAPLLARRGWHLQWYVRPEQLAEVASLHAAGAPTCVLDHLGGMHAGIGDDHPGWRALAQLADAGAWVKLSGWYRLRACAPYRELQPVLRQVLAMFQGRWLWGSDWPHTGFDAPALPGYASTFAPVVEALGQAGALAGRDTPAPIYR